MKRYGPPLALLVAAVGVWELVVRVRDVPDYLFPAPTAVASAFRLGRPPARERDLGDRTRGPARVRGLPSPSRSRIAILIHFSRAAPARATADPRALADGADGAARPDSRDRVRVRAGTEADRRRRRLLLPDRRQRRRRPAFDRRRARADDADARREPRSRSSAASSFPARCRRSSPARASPRPMPRSARSSASGPARRRGSGSSCCSRSRRSTRRASSPPSSFSRRSRSPSTGSSRSPSVCSSPGTGRSSMVRRLIGRRARGGSPARSRRCRRAAARAR